MIPLPSFWNRSVRLRSAIPLLAAGLGTLVPVHAGLDVQVVNDSGLPDSEVFALLVGQPVVSGGAISVSGLAVANGAIVNSPAVNSQAISTLAPAGFNVQSQFSGRSLPVYTFTINSIASGAFIVSYNQAVSYSDSNPSPVTSNFRFDQCELTFDPTIASVANLTSIDAYSIPMQMEVLASATATVPLARRTYFTSTEGLIATFESLQCAGAFYGIASPGAPLGPWKPSEGLDRFVRILGPGKISSGNLAGSPSPFPSFGAYLGSLLTPPEGPYRLAVTGNASGSTYSYGGTVESDGAGGYRIALSGTTVPPPPSPVPANATVTVNLPNGTAPAAQQTLNFDSFIYGAVLSTDSFSVAGMSTAMLQTNINSVYGAITRDVLSGLNFGYLNGRYGTNSGAWYGVPPTRFPFGLARATNDGFYNPWAAVFYNESDAYGFAFSDRSGPSPAVPLENNQTLRITLLPDRRLDSPKVAVTATNSTSLALTWPAVSGATGYDVEILVPGRRAPVAVPAAHPTVSHTLDGLSPGTPYTFTVTATGSTNGHAVRSPGILQLRTTAGTVVPVSHADGVAFNVSFSWSQDVPAGATATINGFPLTYNPSSMQWLNNGINAPVTGIIGTNEYVLTVQDPADGVIFANMMTVSFTGSPASFGVDLRRVVGNQQPLTTAGPPGTPPFSPSLPLTLGVPFTPQPIKAFDRVHFPAVTFAGWLRQFPELPDVRPEGDPDLDGSVNYLEYFRGTQPDAQEVGDFEQLSLDADALRFSYLKSLVTVGVSERVEWSSDLLRWTSEGLVNEPDLNLGLRVRRTVQLPPPSSGPVFLRYTLELP